MPNVQQKKLNKGSLIALVFIAAIIAVMMFRPLNYWVRLVVAVLLLLLFLFIRRGYIYFYRAVVAIKKQNTARIWTNMEKALKAGVDSERRLMIGSSYIQQGDANRGVEILESLIADPKTPDTFRSKAIVTISMGYWRQDRIDKSIEVLEELAETGYRDDNLAINLETYLLEKGDVKKARKVIADGRKANTENNGLLDNRGWFYIETANWKKASEVYDELINDRNAKFPEAYLHAAQVSIHEGNIPEAIDRLGWGTGKRFMLTCCVKKEYLEKLLLGLENPETREAFAKTMDENCFAVSTGKDFPGIEMARPFDESASDVIKPKEKPACSAPAKVAEPMADNGIGLSESDTDKDIDTSMDDDDREPNTDLDEEDYAIAHEYGDDGEAEEVEGPDTSLDDDDEREPNTDLDESDECEK